MGDDIQPPNPNQNTNSNLTNSEPAVVTPDPVTSPQPVAPLDSSPQPAPAGPKKAWWHRPKTSMVALALAIVVVLVGGGALAYVGIIVPNKPENLLSTGIQNSIKAKTVSYEGVVNLEAPDEAQAESLPSITYSGAIDNPNGKYKLDAAVAFPGSDIGVSVVGLDAQAYFKFSGLDTLEGLIGADAISAYQPIIDAINNKWIFFDQPIAGEDTSQLSGKLTEDELKKLAEIYRDHEFIVVSEVHDDETVNGSNSRHLTVKSDNAKLLEFVRAVKDANLENVKITDDDIKYFEESLNEAAADDGMRVDVWIDKGSKTISRIDLIFGDDSGKFTLSTTFKGYNQAVDVQKPEGAKPFSEVLKELEGTGYDELLGGSNSGTIEEPVSTGGGDAERQADIQALHAQLETFYAANGFYPSTDDLLTSLTLDDFEVYFDPEGASVNTGGDYTYTPAPADCVYGECTSYELSATLEDGSKYTKVSLY